MPRLRYSAASKEDLTEIARFIAKDKPDAARKWVAKLRQRCRLAAKHPDIGDDRSDLGERIRSTYVGSYIIFFRENDDTLEIVRILRGDLEYPFL
ncbi:Plasmid stabilization system protein [Stieleria neptunia]|uniref:Plasmid stabilization system protein n=1 Tax=Stieleria neptunia TaxID=2527979 RepID=A0A518HHS9_9BACT|nr:type II toxin-antitoxin system RelE/ParE family toxin [Stieleria neptunia]QDV40401.1 Plasmid stabilization system protein [Stieleria neptunia]